MHRAKRSSDPAIANIRGQAGQHVWLNCVRTPRLGTPSPRTARVAASFGLSVVPAAEYLVGPLRLALAPGQIVFIVGPSGSGKSSALARLATECARACHVQRVRFGRDSAVLDDVAPCSELGEAIRILTSCGLGDARLWLRRFEELSEGERFRARLAAAAALQLEDGSIGPLLCDEFGNSLDGRASLAIAHSLRKLVTRRRLCLVAASTRPELRADLQPDAVLSLRGAGRWNFSIEPPPVERPVSFLRRLQVERGTKSDYAEFAALHYRCSDELGFVDQVYLLRDGLIGDVLGIVVYAHGSIELALRNEATGGYFSRRPRRVNRELRVLRRLVIHPDVRGCGLGQYLVRRTLPQVGTEFVECLAAMGAFNPVFERAGMRLIGPTSPPPQRAQALEALRALGVDPFAGDFIARIANDEPIRRIVSEAVALWYAATTGGGRHRVERQSATVLARTFRGLAATRPVYYIWRRKGA